jgi:transcription antitermination factor NusG
MSLDCQTQAVDQLSLPQLPCPAQWPFYAVRTKSNREFVTHASFLGKGFESYLPTYKRNKSGPSTTRTVELPLFPGYVFCRFDIHRRQPILVTPGVFQIVSFNGLPAPVNENEIAAIQTVTRAGVPAEPWPFLERGRMVRIIAGPLRGLQGPVEHSKGSLRLVVGLSLLQRSLSVEIDRSWIEPI